MGMCDSEICVPLIAFIFPTIYATTVSLEYIYDISDAGETSLSRVYYFTIAIAHYRNVVYDVHGLPCAQRVDHRPGQY